MSALFFACEEATELGAEFNPLNDKIETRYAEIPVDISQIKVDSIVSNYSSENSSIFIGHTESEEFGKQTATAYFNLFLPEIDGNSINSTANLTKAELRIVYGQYPFGKAIGAPQTLRLYQLEEAIQPTDISNTTSSDTTVVLSYKFFDNDKEYVSANLVGQGRFELNPVLQDVNNRDSVLDAQNRRVTFKVQ